MRRAARTPAGELHVREHLLQAARAYVRQHGPNIDQAALVAALEAVAREYRSRGRGRGLRRRPPGRSRRQEGARGHLDAVRPAGAKSHPATLLRQEAPNLFREVNGQRQFLRGWIRRHHLFAIARHEIAVRREAAFAEAGLA